MKRNHLPFANLLFTALNAAFLLFATPHLFVSCGTTRVEGEVESHKPQDPEPKTDPEPEEPKPVEWKAASSLDDLYGVWTCGKNSYEYPFDLNGQRYLKKSYEEVDDTQRWQDFAKKSGLSFSELWQKRFAYLEKIYGEELPASDSSGTQCGIKLRVIGSHVYARREYLIPERILGFNLNFFYLSPEKDRLRENGTFHFASSRFKDFSAGSFSSQNDGVFEREGASPVTFRGTTL